VVDIDNIPSMYERATLQKGCGTLDRFLALRRLLSWRRREKWLGDRFDVLAVCSEEDRKYLRHIGIKVPIHVIPNGFERPLVEPVRPPEAVALSALPAVAAEALVLQRPSVQQRAVFLRSSVLLLPR